MTLVAVTGASGFIGSSLCRALEIRGNSVRAVSRSGLNCVGNIGHDTDWSVVLKGVDSVFHLAARAHVLRETASDPLAAYREVNVEGTKCLAEQAARAGVRRLVFLSSVGVLGTTTNGRPPFSVADSPNPQDFYGQSKWEAEIVLRGVAARTDLEFVIVRPPLVYGPGAKANFGRLMRLVTSGMPLPLGSVRNQRSLVGLDNLVDMLIRCAEEPQAQGETFLVSDGEDVSTPGLLRALAGAYGRSPRLFRVPPKFLHMGGRLVGRAGEIDRLVGSLQVNIDYTCSTLDWRTPYSLVDGLRRSVASS